MLPAKPTLGSQEWLRKSTVNGGSGTGTSVPVGSTPAKASAAVTSAGSSSSAGLPSRVPDGANGS